MPFKHYNVYYALAEQLSNIMDKYMLNSYVHICIANSHMVSLEKCKL